MLFAVFVNQFQDSGGPKIAIFDKISIHPWKFCLVYPSAASRYIMYGRGHSFLNFGTVLKKNSLPLNRFGFVSSHVGWLI